MASSLPLSLPFLLLLAPNHTPAIKLVLSAPQFNYYLPSYCLEDNRKIDYYRNSVVLDYYRNSAVLDFCTPMQRSDILVSLHTEVLFSQAELWDNPRIQFEDRGNGTHQVAS